MNRIRVGTVDDIDKTYVELNEKKFRCLAPPTKINSPNGQRNVGFSLTNGGYSHG